ncbi:hypothetical protein SLEP1_g24205 [Rubroshorea leprosula]|uniref:Uncharacterized protein n=1 Tax=Rubroshorea leprosula TaxID=152421 RepID=A0AAV5JM46_9ROSI|nr:hypothetical protein SLEP1_g24205 [Rubroshorea leprosula]
MASRSFPSLFDFRELDLELFLLFGYCYFNSINMRIHVKGR